VKPEDRWACWPTAAETPASKNIKEKISENGSL